jgi:hypothetical protein
MKVIFNFVLMAVLAAVWLRPAPAAAERYHTKKSILADFFPKSDSVSYIAFTPSAAERGQLKQRLGYLPARAKYYFYVAKTGDRIDGYAFIDNELGQHEPITFAVKLSADGVVQRQEVLAYREKWGSEIRHKRFRKQFVGKTVRDRCQAGRDIHVVSGATISSHAMARGVRRSLVLFDLAIRTRAHRTASTR